MSPYRVVRSYTTRTETDRDSYYGGSWWNRNVRYEDITYRIDKYEVREYSDGDRETVWVEAWEETNTITHD